MRWLILLSLFSLFGCSQDAIKDDGPEREPASSDACRAYALHYFGQIQARQRPDSVHLVFFSEPAHATLAFFTYGWQRDLEASGDDRAFYIHFDRHCRVLSIGGGTASMEKIK